MRRLGRLRWVLALLATPIVLLLVAHGMLVYALPLDRVASRLTADLGYPVDVKSVTARILPSPRVRLHEVEIAGSISVENAEIELRLLPLLRGDFEGGSAWLRGVEVAITRRADGGVEIEGLAQAPAQRPETAPPPLSGAGVIPSLPPLHVRGAVIHYRDEQAPDGTATTEVHLSHVDLRTRQADNSLTAVGRGRIGGADDETNLQIEAEVGAPADGKRPIRVSIQTEGLDPEPVPRHLPAKWGVRAARGSLKAKIDLAWNDPVGFEGALDLKFTESEVQYAGINATGDVEFQAKLDNRGAFQLSDGVLRADAAHLGPLDTREVRARLGHEGDTVTFETLAFESWGGSIETSGTITVGEPLSFDLQVDADNLSLYRLEHPRGGDPPEDQIRMSVHGPVHGYWTGGDGWLERIAGELQVSMHGGELLSGDMFESLMRVMPRHYPEHHDPSRKSTMDTTPLEKLEAGFELDSGRARTQDLVVVTEDYQIETGGWLDGAGEYRFEGNLVFTPKGLSRVLAAASVQGRHDGRGGLPSCPFAISGNFATGKFKVHLDDQPLAALVILPWAVSQMTEATVDLFDASKNGIDRTVDFFEGMDGDEPEPSPE